MSDYLKRFINSKSCEELIGLFTTCGNPAKEITESWGMLEAAKKYCKELYNWKVIVVGDGKTPRTGAFLAFYTGADVLSIDPDVDMARFEKFKNRFRVKRVECVAAKIEDITEIDCGEKPCLVIWPHSHGNMNNCNIINYSVRVDIALPCCVQIPKNWLERPHIHYFDFKITSEKRQVYVWGADHV